MSDYVVCELSQSECAEHIYHIMQDAYAVEAHLLNAQDFPPLRRTVRDVATSSNQFIGAFQHNALIGVCELEHMSKGVTLIASTVVSPTHFRRGVASLLIEHVLKRDDMESVMVSTAQDNAPAIALYQKHGFVVHDSEILPDGMKLVTLQVLCRSRTCH